MVTSHNLHGASLVVRGRLPVLIPPPCRAHASYVNAIPPLHRHEGLAAAATAGTTAMSLLSSLPNLGLGYSIAIALGFLVLFASLLLASYLCFRRGGGDYWVGEAATTASSSGHLSITVPRVLFVAEGSESPDAAAAASCSPVGLNQAALCSGHAGSGQAGWRGAAPSAGAREATAGLPPPVSARPRRGSLRRLVRGRGGAPTVQPGGGGLPRRWSPLWPDPRGTSARPRGIGRTGLELSGLGLAGLERADELPPGGGRA